jgi:NTE family protein
VKRQVLFFIFCTQVLLSSISYGQRVAIVLSGGGAKGLAYIGALKALEENGIPIDYIIGTSMGGLVDTVQERWKNWSCHSDFKTG